MTPIGFELNGKHVKLEGCASHTTLLEFVRAQGLTGSKEGCAEGECGACTVLFVKPHGAGSSKLVPVNSCLVLLPMVAGQEVYTVEALASEGRLADVQRAMVEQGGSQCGYCTPGFVVSMFAEQYRPDRSGPCDPHNLGGNLCRCTGYRPIRDALASVGAPADERFLTRMAKAAPVLGGFKASGFARPDTLSDCLRLMKEPEALLIAGATDLAVESNLRGRRFEHLVSVEALPELRVFSDTADEVVIGAGLSLSEIGDMWQDAPPIFREWLPLFAWLLIRNRATLGGNLATASPIGDSAPMLLAMDARVKIAGQDGSRMVALSEFFVGYRKTAMQAGEVLVSVHIPKPLPRVARFFKIAKRRMDDISTVAVGIAIHHNGMARIAYGGVAATPVRVIEAERELPLSLERAKRAVAAALAPISDHRASSAYRLAMAQSLLDKFAYEGGL